MCNESEKYLEIYQISFYCSILSALSCILILSILYRINQSKNPSVKILYYMSAIDLTRSTLFFFPYSWSKNWVFCTVFAVITNWGTFSNSAWAFFIVYTLYRMQKSSNNPEFSLKFWNFLVFIVTPLYQILPIFTQSYGFNAGFCGFSNDTYGYVWRGIQQGLIVICTCVGICVYIWIYCRLRYRKKGEFSELIFEKGMIYSLIYFFTVGILVVFRYSEKFEGFCSLFWLAIVNYSVMSLHGFFNFVAVLLNKNFRSAFWNSFKKNDEKDELDEIILDIIQND